MAKSWFQVVKDAVQMYKDRDNYAYFYGAKGQRLTKNVMDALWAAEPEYFKKYNAEEKAQIYKNSLNKIGLDCSGFVTRVTGETGYSISIYNKRTKETSLADGVAGQFLFTTFGGSGRHIGIDAGLGFALDMGYESTDYSVSVHRDSVRLTNIGETAWEHSFQTAAVNYNGAYAFDPNGNAQPQPGDTVEPDPILPDIPDPDDEVVLPRAVQATTIMYVRSGPGTDYSRVTFDRNDGKGARNILAQGEVAEVIGMNGDWYQLQITGASQVWRPYASSEYLNPVEFSEKIGTATTKLNVRTGPGSAYSLCKFDRNDGKGIRNTLEKGESARVITESNGWCQLEIVGEEYVWRPWASKKYLTVV